MEELSLHDLIAIFKRRKQYFIVTTIVLLVLTVLGALRWSNYRSTATVQIEQSNITHTLASPTADNAGAMVETLADERISEVEQTVTSIDSLSAIIKKFDLYGGARSTVPLAGLATKMRDKIKLNFISSTIANPAEAQKASAEQLSAIAFTLSFDYNNPEITQQVTNELVSLFLEEDLELHRRQAKDTSAFLQAQISGLEEQMAEQEKKIADYRGKHGESGPAALMFNQQAAATTNLALQTLEGQIAANEGTEGTLRSQLATVDPYSRVIADGQVLTTPAVQLKALQAQYSTLSSQYGPDHPDVIKARHQIEALQQAVKTDHHSGGPAGAPVDTAQLEAQIRDVKTNLAVAEANSGADNPDVIALRAKLKKLEARYTAAQKSGGGEIVSGIKADADSPAYLQLSSQLQSNGEQHKSFLAQRDALMAQQTRYQQAIAENPGSEQQMEVLSRDYENEQLRYRELKEKKMTADMTEQLELGGKGQRLIVNTPPTLPTKTHPPKLVLIIAGAFFSVLGGFAAVVATEVVNQSVYGARQLAPLTGAAPLATIPYITTVAEIERRRKRLPYILAAVVVLIFLIGVIFPLVVMPYDVLWSEIAQKLNLS